ncbi:hypothetical protein [Sphingomonas sp. G-3-2-10]|uniref:hypothetical protein n=1 Tax=Sphingomonas sp. G-3-2-10 TaxID=2728838 RepID=UPI001469D169|nr:hypothetical protein [Sphingomonas sp. G-3-2-10]NML04283.1 hypothetical protein [Sphingomonas sp. G-3-2-10]
MTKDDAQRAYMGRNGKSQFSRWENANEVQVSWGNTGRTISRIERWYDVDVNVLIAQMIAKYGEPTNRAMASDTAPMSLRGPRYGTAIQVEVLTWRVGQVVIEVRNPHNDYRTSGFATYTIIDAAKPLEI